MEEYWLGLLCRVACWLFHGKGREEMLSSSSVKQLINKICLKLNEPFSIFIEEQLQLFGKGVWQYYCYSKVCCLLRMLTILINFCSLVHLPWASKTSRRGSGFPAGWAITLKHFDPLSLVTHTLHSADVWEQSREELGNLSSFTSSVMLLCCKSWQRTDSFELKHDPGRPQRSLHCY